MRFGLNPMYEPCHVVKLGITSLLLNGFAPKSIHNGVDILKYDRVDLSYLPEVLCNGVG